MRKTFVIGINGGTASGKSNAANILKEYLNKSVSIFNQDHYYYLEEDQEKDENGEANFDLPTSLDLDLFQEHFHDLINKKSVKKERYNYNKPLGTLSKYVEFHPAEVLIVEGMYIYNNTEEFYDHKIFIHTDRSLQIQRRLLRDKVERGYDADDVHYKFKHHIDEPFEKYVLPNKEKAQDVVENTLSFDQFESKIIEISKKLNSILDKEF